MNTSNPVASEICSVDFKFLSKEDIRQISVKKIVNPVTFQATTVGGIPIPATGGLYDSALGASDALRQRCATCHLDSVHCPGHIGHIELPVGVYNPLFFDQIYSLLRSTCVYCFHFRAPRVEVDRYACKLRLIQHGLLKEAYRLDDTPLPPEIQTKKRAVDRESGDNEEGSDNGMEMENFITRRRKYVQAAINAARGRHDAQHGSKVVAIAEERRQVVKQTLREFLKVKKCTRCQASITRSVGVAYRKDGYSKIFERDLSVKNVTANAQLGLRRGDMLELKKQYDETKRKATGIVSMDEGINKEVDNGLDSEEGCQGEELVAAGKKKAKSGTLLLSEQVRKTLVRLFENEQCIIQLLYNPRSVAWSLNPITPDIFFLDIIAVPPTKFRPPQVTSNEITEAAANRSLVKIIQDCVSITDRMTIQNSPHAGHKEKSDAAISMLAELVSLQDNVNVFLDSTKSGTQSMGLRNAEDGIKQKLEKKEGLFRKNMMGKRVNFAARSVISPDPNIETSEIGVPLVFATKLTYPEAVTDDNVEEMMKLVQAGPDNWPGAVSIEMEDGTVQKLPHDRINSGKETRQNLSQLLQTPNVFIGDARPKKIHRHLQTGDFVLMNRQPTLHKPSIMGHRARVLQKERTIRMHYANCNTYNADFDGDEMNMHLPQNAIAQAEAREIANTNSQYLIGTSGRPLRGLIQDHLVMAVQFTNRDTFFTRSEYHQLMYSCLLPERNSIYDKKSNRIITVTPTILKPKPLWTGKQIITSILENIMPNYFEGLTLTSKSKVPAEAWYLGCEEDRVIFDDGYFVCGILDKKQIGPEAFGLVHSIYEIYGPSTAGSLLSILGRLLTKFLHMRAHTCGMDDLLLSPEANNRRRNILSGSATVGRELSVEYVGLKGTHYSNNELHERMEEVLRDQEKQKVLDLKANAQTKNFTSSVIGECLPIGLQKQFPANNFQSMTISGAKGSDVNASQISCLLGQQVLEGRRVPVMVSGKTLPCFKPYETDVRAGGYVTDRFLTGIRPQEYYFHCMAGREGLIDTAVKTSRSGYLQRCLIKGMEGIRVAYDNTVRDSDGSLIQFLYGEDGLDVTKQTYLKEFKFCGQNMQSLLRRLTGDFVNKDILPTLKTFGERFHVDYDASKRVRKAMKKLKKETNKLESAKKAEITMCELSPSCFVGSTSERFFDLREKYIAANEDNIIRSSAQKNIYFRKTVPKTQFRSLMDLKYLNSMVDPGEAVGIVAGQSIGEPSTQMTLNTFHLAGHATKNVTLGIPRLREIVMTASASIATPTMTLTLNQHLSEVEADRFAKERSRLILSEVIDHITIIETTKQAYKNYLIHIEFFPEEEYIEQYSVTKSELETLLKTRFIADLKIKIERELKTSSANKTEQVVGKNDALPKIGESVGKDFDDVSPRNRADEDEDDVHDTSDEDTDMDIAMTKQRARKQEIEGYDEPDEEENDLKKQAERAGSLGLLDEEERRQEKFLEDNEQSEPESSCQIPAKEIKTPGAILSNNSDSLRFDQKGQWYEINLQYPAESPKVLMLNILENVCRKTIVREVPLIGTVARVSKNKHGQDAGVHKLAVEGVNFAAFWSDNDVIDMTSIETNDVAQVLKYYGVEAARTTIVKEINAVFKGHGIAVDARHLNLIADIMTRYGEFTPFNRQGLQKNVSPFLKMSFETTCNFLKEAVVEGDWDDLTSPSSRIVIGKVSAVGSGSFDVMINGF